METKDIFEIWEKGNDKLLTNDKTSKAMITDYLNKKTKKATVYFSFNILFYIAVQLINIILCSMNSVAYQMNPVIHFVLIGLLILSTGIFTYGIILFIQYREIKNFSNSLLSLLNKQLRFIKVKYEVWMIVLTLSVLILIFNINIIADYNDGYYPINNKLMYVIINIVLFVFIYGIQKVSGFRLIAEFKAYLSDLKSGVLEHSQKLEKGKKRQKLLIIALVIFFSLTVVAGFLKATGVF